MKVYKFGGASINSPERMQRSAALMMEGDYPRVIVVSAMGKITNALEAVAEAFFSGKKEDALRLFDAIKQSHIQRMKYMLVKYHQSAGEAIQQVFTEVEWLLHDDPVRNFDYYYDQIVCSGELMSTIIMAHYLREQGCRCAWLDVRDVLRTNDRFRDAGIDWPVAQQRVCDTVIPLLKENDVVLTQGFIGATADNESTTLGREGSDYTAAAFAYMLDAASVTIWKDVEAVMNADPRIFPNAINIPELSYLEVIEMAYYGAQVIHPKTIKPLQNKNIPLFVKSFLDPLLPGTVITQKPSRQIPPVIIIKLNQVLVSFQSKDFSFVEGKPAEILHELFHQHHVKSNLSQHTAISLLSCFDDDTEKIDGLAAAAAEWFDINLRRGLTLLTIRHYDEATIKENINGKKVVLEQKTEQTIQVVLEETA